MRPSLNSAGDRGAVIAKLASSMHVHGNQQDKYLQQHGLAEVWWSDISACNSQVSVMVTFLPALD